MDCPGQVSNYSRRSKPIGAGAFDMRDYLNPRRLTIVMWDQAFLLRHMPGESFEDYNKVLDEVIERGYNTLRLDPLPQWIDLKKPGKVLKWPARDEPYFPWGWYKGVEGPAGKWLIEFMEKTIERGLNYTLSAWWFCGEKVGPPVIHRPVTHLEAAEMWASMLHTWKKRFGFRGLVYVDITNEVPFFLPEFGQRFARETGGKWDQYAVFTQEQITYIAQELNPALACLQREFPELRFTCSIHGDTRWLDVPVEFDCLDAHFYSDADLRWRERTAFYDHMQHLYTDSSWHKDFSDRCAAARDAVAPMLRARQRTKLAAFAQWAEERGMPLTTSESWASWFYFDSPDLDWGWLLEWAEWSVEDAIEFNMWGWTPHNYCQPQFKNWQDVRWHQRLTSKFLSS